MAKLIMLSGGVRKEFELGRFNTIGRHPDNSVQILDRIISKEHAQVVQQPDGRFLLKDLGSLNGTYLGSSRVTEQVLNHGDEITMGSTRLQFSDQPGGEESLNRVTIAAGTLTESHIRQKIDAEKSQDFLPAKDLPPEVLKRDYEKLRMAHELGRAIVGILDLEQLLPKILDKSFELLAADRGVILLQENSQLVPKYVKSRGNRGDEQIILSNSIINEVVQNKKAVLSSDATMDSRFSGAHSIIMQGIRSTMSVPLMHGAELLGVMYLDSQVAANAFTEKDLQLFSSISNQAAVAIQNARLARKIEQEARTRAQFQRLLSPNLVEQVVSGQLQLDQGGVLREVTMMFADIRGFTSMSERAKEPTEIVAMLNEYFELMIEILFKWQGTLDKYVGDEIMALFGAPVPTPDAPWQAVQCAIEMQRALREFNRTRQADNLEPIRIGIGINTGMVVTGTIGSSHTKQYTAVGDAVNTASRLCSLAKSGEIIISEHTMARVAGRVEAVTLPPTKVKGKLEPLNIYNVVRRKGDDSTAELQKDRTRPG